MVEILNESWVDSQLEKFPGARKDVLEFISKIVGHCPHIEESYRTIEILFAAGYCYYFARMLEDAFGGEVCWHKNHGHIVWKDETEVCYDVYGVFEDYGRGDILSLSELGDGLESFRHRGQDEKKGLELS